MSWLPRSRTQDAAAFALELPLKSVFEVALLPETHTSPFTHHHTLAAVNKVCKMVADGGEGVAGR